nr:reverse transcriptase domain-containing protein [Tanacetum cinerariifolium]
MSAMANTTPLVTTVTKPATNPRDPDATPRVNIQEFCEEYYEDILPIIMDKVRHDRRKDIHTRLDFGEGHRRRSAFDRLSETYSASTTKSRPRGTGSRDHPRGKSRPHSLDTSKEDRPKDRERLRDVGESYDDSFSHSYRDGNRSRHMKRRRDNESPLSSMSRSDSSDGRYRRSKRHKSTDEDDLTKPWMCEEEDPFTPRIRNFESSRRTRMPNNVKTYDGAEDPEDHVKNFQVATQVERWAMPTWCHIFNSTLIGAARVWFDELPPESIDSYKDLKAALLAYFMQQKKYGAPECMQISRFMHGVNNPELIKRLNEHVSKTMEEMMITTTAFIWGEAVAASKKKGHASWKAQDQSKRQNSDKRSDFQGHSREEKGSNRFSPLTRTSKEILAAEAGGRTRPANFKVALHPDFPDQEVAIDELCSILKKNLNIFAWQPSDMTGVPRGLKTGGGRDHERGLLPRLAVQPIHATDGQAFESQIGRNIEVYVDDLVVKSYTEAEMMRDIEETFRTLRKVNMKLNPKKCAFGLAEGMFLGYVVTPEGIKPCPDKTAAVLQLPSSRTIKEVQSLNGKLASLNRFLSKSAEKSLPLFQTLKKCIKKSDFHWTAEAEQAFKQLKQHLSE